MPDEYSGTLSCAATFRKFVTGKTELQRQPSITPSTPRIALVLFASNSCAAKGLVFHNVFQEKDFW